MKPSRRHVQAGGVVFVRSKVLLRKTRSGDWIFPKGHVEDGETFPQTAEREILEETGVQSEADQYLGSIRYRIGDDRYDVRLYSMTYLGTAKAWRKHEGVDAFLVKPEKAERLLSFDDYRRILAAALRRRAVDDRGGPKKRTS